MKQMMIAVLTLLFVGAGMAQDQRQGPPKPPPHDKRWEKDSEKIKKAVTLSADEFTKMKATFMTFYKDMDALLEKSKGQRPKKEDVDKVLSKRNEAIKKFLAKDKYDKFLKIEKELGPPKGPPKEGRPE